MDPAHVMGPILPFLFSGIPVFLSGFVGIRESIQRRQDQAGPWEETPLIDIDDYVVGAQWNLMNSRFARFDARITHLEVRLS